MSHYHIIYGMMQQNLGLDKSYMSASPHTFKCDLKANFILLHSTNFILKIIGLCITLQPKVISAVAAE
jgi:hypothetical protein